MAELQLVTHSIDVPKNTGIEGFMITLRELLKLTRLQSINIDAKGKVTYKRYAEDGERQKIGVDYEGVEPWHIARNAPDGVEELLLSSPNAAVTLAAVLDRASGEKLYSTAFVASPNTILWKWYQYTTGFSLGSPSHLCGLPVYFDRHIPDSALILCASFAKEGALVDTQKAYKIEMNYVVAPTTDVEVIV
jgi:hypothetical protein